MHWLDWIIVTVPLFFIFGLAFYSKRYVRSVVDFLAAGRVAGRYVISVGDMQSALSVITLVALVEAEFQCGIGIGFWSKLNIPLAIFMSLTGYVLYRYRQTRSLSLGQFLEMRYNRPLRIVAAAIRTLAEAMANAIGPAVAARFFIYMLGIPNTVSLFGWQVSSFALVMFILILLCLLLIWPGGRISLLVTDTLQGLISYPVFVIITCFVLSEISWHTDVAPVMTNRIPGESFINPNDIQGLRDFNLFALIVNITASILNRGAWIGNDTSGAGRTPHEQKMAGVLGAWKNGFSALMMTMLALFVITVMNGDRFTGAAKDIRVALSSRVAQDAITDKAICEQAVKAIKAVPEWKSNVPLSRKDNPDVPYFNAIRSTLADQAEKEISANPALTDDEKAEIRGKGSKIFQVFRTLYYQEMAPVMLSRQLPKGIFGVFVLLMVMLMLSTDDSRIFNAAGTLVQDVVMPFRKKPFSKAEHFAWLRGMTVAVCAFFFFASLFFAQLDFITMFINIMCSLWLGAAGPIMLGGLYTRWGNTSGAFGALLFGSGSAFGGLICQRTWANSIYPFLEVNGWLDNVAAVFNAVNNLCSPLIVWEMNPEKFPINSFEIYFISMMLGIIGYFLGSMIGFRKPYNLDRLLHRGDYADENTPQVTGKKQSLIARLVGITPEYTKGDRIIAWSVFYYAIVYQFLIAFVCVVIWNFFSPFSAKWWSWYFFITIAVVGLLVGIVSTIWFMWGGIRDLRQLFVDLAKREENPLDDGWVEGNVSLADREKFSAREQQIESREK